MLSEVVAHLLQFSFQSFYSLKQSAYIKKKVPCRTAPVIADPCHTGLAYSRFLVLVPPNDLELDVGTDPSTIALELTFAVQLAFVVEPQIPFAVEALTFAVSESLLHAVVEADAVSPHILFVLVLVHWTRNRKLVQALLPSERGQEQEREAGWCLVL